MKRIIIPLIALMWGCTTPREYINNTIDRIITYDTVRVVIPSEPDFKPIVLDSYENQNAASEEVEAAEEVK